MKPNSLKRPINDVLIGVQSGMFAPRCIFHAVKSPNWEMTPEKCQISDMSTVSLHHRKKWSKTTVYYT